MVVGPEGGRPPRAPKIKGPLPSREFVDGEGELKVADFRLATGRTEPPHPLRHPSSPRRSSRRAPRQGRDRLRVVHFVSPRLPPIQRRLDLINMYRKIYADKFVPESFLPPPLAKILDPNPATRIDTDGIMEHPWFYHGTGGNDELEKLMRGHEEEAWFKTEFKTN
ncbi:hypothetical protein ZWY2020_005841 [Hordeum vulgare]|nr:hypothetical protein ZWY2020_005841 [Hordeum vulgare]